MKCRFPVAKVDGVTIAILPCKWNHRQLGLLLHPAPADKTQGPSPQIYYVSWSFRQKPGSRYDLFRLASLDGDVHNLCFRGKPVTTTWCNVCVAAHPPTTGRRDGGHLLQGFVPDVLPTAFRVPRTLMQTLGALEFFPRSRTVSWDPASKDTMVIGCDSTTLVEAFRIIFGTCTKVSTKAYSCHWVWAGQHNRATWGHPWPEYVHDCATDHITAWPNNTRNFGDAERTIRLKFSPCTQVSDQTLRLDLELVGSVYEEIQRKANIYLRPRVKVPRLQESSALSEVALL